MSGYWNDTRKEKRRVTPDGMHHSIWKNQDGTICPGGDECSRDCTMFMTGQQVATLHELCKRYKVPFDPLHYAKSFALPEGWVAGWIGGPDHAALDRGGRKRPTIYVGVSMYGESHS